MQAGGTQPFEPATISRDGRTIRRCASDCASWPRSGDALAIGAWAGCWREKAIVMNRKKLYRIYREEKLMVRRRGRRKRALGTRAPTGIARCDQSALVARLRRQTRSAMAAASASSASSTTSAANAWPRWSIPRSAACASCANWNAVALERGLPRVIVSDNGCELTSTAVLRWSIGRLDWHYIEPGKPVQNAFVESSTAACATNVSTSMYS